MLEHIDLYFQTMMYNLKCASYFAGFHVYVYLFTLLICLYNYLIVGTLRIFTCINQAHMCFSSQSI